jgi:hypothetical protein
MATITTFATIALTGNQNQITFGDGSNANYTVLNAPGGSYGTQTVTIPDSGNASTAMILADAKAFA